VKYSVCGFLSTKLLQIVDGQFVQEGDDFFGYGQLPGVVGVCYRDGVHSRGLAGLQAPVRVLDDDALAGVDRGVTIFVEFLQG